MNNWNIFLIQFQKDFTLWLFCILYLSLFRMVFIFSFRQQADNSSTWRDVAAVLLNGVRFDSMVAGYFILIPFLFTLSCNFADMQSSAENARAISGNTFIVLSTVLCGITLGYFKEYNDQINHFIFGIYYDDPQAILTTIWKEYRPILSAFLMGLVILKGLSLKGLFMEKFPTFTLTYSPSAVYRIIMAMMSIYLVFIGIRGSLGSLGNLFIAGMFEHNFGTSVVLLLITLIIGLSLNPSKLSKVAVE